MFCIILFAHGSRDPLWHRPMEAVATRLRAMAPHVPVRCAYLELSQPSLPEAAAELVAAGATRVRIVPLFLGTGRHAREDLPALAAQLRDQYARTRFELQDAVGEDPRLIELLANIALEPGAGNQ